MPGDGREKIAGRKGKAKDLTQRKPRGDAEGAEKTESSVKFEMDLVASLMLAQRFHAGLTCVAPTALETREFGLIRLRGLCNNFGPS
jgi:hypothetical protein